MKRTLADAERTLAEQPVERRDFRAQLEAAKGEARKGGEATLEEEVPRVAERLLEAQKIGAVEVRDLFESLTSQIASEEVPHGEGVKRVHSLSDRLRELENTRNELEKRIEFLEQIEANPEVWMDGLFAKFSDIKPNFDF